jgi:hypothetical protein
MVGLYPCRPRTTSSLIGQVAADFACWIEDRAASPDPSAARWIAVRARTWLAFSDGGYRARARGNGIHVDKVTALHAAEASP